MSINDADHVVTVPAVHRRRLPAFLRSPGGVFGAGWLVLVIVLSFTAGFWRPYGINEQDLANRFALPGADHWLGTDEMGRDLLSRILTAGAQPLLTSALTVLVAFGLGIPMALLAAEHGPRFERWFSRLSEILLALPGMIILLAVIGAVGVRLNIVMTVLGVMISAAVYRVMLGVAKSVRQRLYVDAARVNGLGSLRVNVKYVVPGMATVMAVQAAQLFGIAILIQSGLAFMGFGPPSPQPSWGGMIGDASQQVYNAPWLMVPTGVVLALTVVAANALADAIAGQVAGERPVARRRRRKATRGGAEAREGETFAADTVPADQVPADTVPADRAPVLDVRDLTVAVDDGPATVTDVSFSLRAGRVLGLVGESGCGKTMTARALIGLLPDGVAVSGGSIGWQGRDLAALPEDGLRAIRGREIAMISQEPMVALDPMFSVAYQLTVPIRRFRGVGRGEARRIAAELLNQVGIVDAEGVLRSYPHQLSGGMAQRVAIALALTGRPKLLIADEPTTALDVTVQAEILSLLRALVRDTGLSVLIVSHDLGVVADICDDIAVMYAGQVVESGAAAAVLDDPRMPYTMALLAANPHVPEGQPVPERLACIPGTVPPPADWPAGCRFADRCRFAAPECSAPIPLFSAHESGSVRCVRVDEIDRTHLTWEAESLGAEEAADTGVSS
ncbi:dipeptide/oligopeptide/nickel ABC transporter permease/ATP-binding protein [Haloechinothrix halophila]|uniref:dipeptide/oligopeptide/nickel ABC transporter permease/ATP-binding protein n=1 Tax=Haloechinothrix halophila TaxID=1069073 RepID=UPI000415487B|nr:dipeptide/oligopeptide/nickel ABC transporter permease/ATP-binding protein [Haloechinothrix halophila]